jgi:8-amino-7-oxononanoate synthase
VADDVAGQLARLVGLPAATVHASTLHACWDVFASAAGEAAVIAVDAAAYPIAPAAARCRGRVRVVTFAHHDPRGLAQVLACSRGPVVVVCDGLCPSCGTVAPLPGYLEAVRARGGFLLVDDTQALGLLGRSALGHPYGSGGGGSAIHLGLTDPHLVVVASLAKAFSVPIAFVAGSADRVRRIERLGPTRMHCSPPSNAHLGAAVHAIESNARTGDARRRRVHELVLQLRRGLVSLGLRVSRGTFPMQVVSGAGVPLAVLHRRLLSLGVSTVLHGSCRRTGPVLSFLVTAAHGEADIAATLAVVSRALTTPSDRRRAS